jgi:hypothetical protein
LGGGSGGSWRGAFGVAQRQIPARERRNRLECCILCAASGRDVSFLVAVFFAEISTFLAPKTPTFVNRPFNDETDWRGIGWASSWSSRAPPFLS